MKIVIAPDSFKESLSALEVCHAIQAGFQAVFPQADYHKIPMADGGEGTTSALKDSLQGTWHTVSVHDPLMRPITAQYAMLPNRTAVIEMASASGLHLLAPNERNPHIASTYGVGEMIAHAIEQGAETIILGIGGSATNDGGAGGCSGSQGWFWVGFDPPVVPPGYGIEHAQCVPPSEFSEPSFITESYQTLHPISSEELLSLKYESDYPSVLLREPAQDSLQTDYFSIKQEVVTPDNMCMGRASRGKLG